MTPIDDGPLTLRMARTANNTLALEIHNSSDELTLTNVEALPVFLERDEEHGERRAMIKFDPIPEAIPPNGSARFSHHTRFAKDLPDGTDDPWDDAAEGNDLLILLTKRSSRRHSYNLDLRFLANGESEPRFQVLALGAGSNLEISN